MGRSTPHPAFENHVRSIRSGAGLSQHELAVRAGLTRQAISAIEAGDYVPNTVVALQLADVLGCRVEDLFALGAVAPSPSAVHVISPPAGESPRVAAGYVRGRLVGYPLAGERALQESLVGIDAIVEGHSAAILATPVRLEKTAILLGCDPSLGLLGSNLPGGLRLLWLQASSTAALAAVRAGEAHIAGTHLPQHRQEPTRPPEQQALGAIGGLVVTFTAWEQGFVVAPGNPKGIRSAADLARPGVTAVNREAGSGSRAFLDGLLAAEGVPASTVKGYNMTANSHFAVARAVAAGLADAGVGLRAVAEAFGLGFVPIDQVRFDLVIPRDHLEHPTVAAVLDLLTRREVREALRALPGYDVSETGRTVATIAPNTAA